MPTTIALSTDNTRFTKTTSASAQRLPTENQSTRNSLVNQAGGAEQGLEALVTAKPASALPARVASVIIPANHTSSTG
jgi:hypothetical protein